LVYEKCWSNESVATYFTSESRQKAERKVFERTHLPINKIKVEFCQVEFPQNKQNPQSNQREFITEEELKALITSSRLEDYNRIFLVVGETGCGKSELCQWLEYNIADGVHVPIHISKSDVRIDQISRILNLHLPDTSLSPVEPDRLIDVPSNYIADRLVSDLNIKNYGGKIVEHGSEKRMLEELFNRAEFKKAVQAAIREYQEDVKSKNEERGLPVLSKASFRSLLGKESPSDLDAIYNRVGAITMATLKDLLRVSDIATILQQISQRYYELKKRPVLLLEDLTSFSVMAKDLIDYVFDLAKGHFDVVIGWSTGFEQEYTGLILRDLEKTYMTERLAARLVLTGEDSSAYFLKDTYKDLARKYLSAVKCGKCAICSADKEGLYPFNSACLDRIYQNMQFNKQSKRTPRIFLDFIIQNVLLSSNEPWVTLSASNFLKPVIYLTGQAYPECEDFEQLVRWYGREKKDVVELDRKCVDWFKIRAPIEPSGEVYIVQKSVIVKPPEKPPTGQVEEIPEQDLIEFQSWIDSGGSFPSRERLRQGAMRALQLVLDPCEIRNLGSTISWAEGLYYQKGSGHVPVFIEESEDDITDVEYKAAISRKTSRNVLYQIYQLGCGREFDEKNLVEVLEWAKEHALKYNDQLRTNLGRMGTSIEKFVLFSKFLILNLSTGCTTIDINKIRDAVSNKDDILFFSDHDLYQKSEALLQQSRTIQALFRTFFHLTKTFFDYQLFERSSAEIDPAGMLTTIANLNWQGIRDAYRIRVRDGEKEDKVKFRELAEVVRDYAQALQKLKYTQEFSAEIEELRATMSLIPASCSLDEVTSNIGNLKNAMGEIGLSTEQSWREAFADLSVGELDFKALRDELDLILTDMTKCDNPLQFVDFLLRSGRARDRSEFKVIRTLQEMTLRIKELLAIRITEVNSKIKPNPNFGRFEKVYERINELVSEFKE
jgi:hypothetical protein